MIRVYTRLILNDVKRLSCAKVHFFREGGKERLGSYQLEGGKGEGVGDEEGDSTPHPGSAASHGLDACLSAGRLEGSGQTHRQPNPRHYSGWPLVTAPERLCCPVSRGMALSTRHSQRDHEFRRHPAVSRLVANE